MAVKVNTAFSIPTQKKIDITMLIKTGYEVARIIVYFRL
jgi:hypothetical protein